MKFEEQLLRVALIGAHSNFSDKGFRQTDLRFLTELFTNWMDVFLMPQIPQWQNTQAMRFLNHCEKEGQVRSKGEGKNKKYRLTRRGLLENVYSLMEVQGFSDIKYVLLTYYFLQAYQNRIINLIQAEGSGFSKAMQVEVEHLFNHKLYLDRQLQELKRMIQRMDLRISETKKAKEMAQKLHRQGENHHYIMDKVAQAHPYELENQKPMAELLKEISPEVQLWELTHGNYYRGEVLWNSQMQVLRANYQILKELYERKDHFS